ncbi:hypothetical protein GV827_01505 [Sulfitobacter sp. JBTF-M27]|uniref:DUF2244 domain-containing protein n=1 Tax=Sulfitobacter sediminilitoris TaxID=2698830 RepID=A0A6P0C6N4_9RHOB|nr:hypothetical protein [Sulfitobacter sediminilitoris]NEK21080.1 hypothetical protein [Sulfitobacter sediminilitoris]
MSTDFTYHRQGRSLRAGLIVLAIWLALAGAYFVLDAALWIVGFLAFFTLPALWDLYRNPPSGLTLTDQEIRWFTGKRTAQVALEEIERVRLDTRLDFSVRVTLVLQTGAKIRLPFEATPPHQALEDALNAHGLTTRRTHFQLMQ